MGIRSFLKKHLPSYRTERRMMEEMEKLRADLREMSKKNEMLFWNAQMLPSETMQQTKERVYLNMPKATGRLRNIQLAENHILQRVKKLCDENGMHVFLVGGTLLGAVRHHGFIPWDNDIDVGMMKADYLKLRTLLENDIELRAEYCYNYASGLRMSKIKYRGTDVFWIDILVFDYIDVKQEEIAEVWPRTQQANREYGKKIQELAKEHLGKSYCRPVENHTLDTALREFEPMLLTGLPKFGQGEYFCEPIDCPYWSRDPRGIMKASEFFPLLADTVEFEGVKYEVWKNYQRALELAYGDIWTLPFSISEPHTTEFDEGFEEGIAFLKRAGILPAEDKEV